MSCVSRFLPCNHQATEAAIAFIDREMAPDKPLPEAFEKVAKAARVVFEENTRRARLISGVSLGLRAISVLAVVGVATIPAPTGFGRRSFAIISSIVASPGLIAWVVLDEPGILAVTTLTVFFPALLQVRPLCVAAASFVAINVFKQVMRRAWGADVFENSWFAAINLEGAEADRIRLIALGETIDRHQAFCGSIFADDPFRAFTCCCSWKLVAYRLMLEADVEQRTRLARKALERTSSCFDVNDEQIRQLLQRFEMPERLV